MSEESLAKSLSKSSKRFQNTISSLQNKIMLTVNPMKKTKQDLHKQIQILEEIRSQNSAEINDLLKLNSNYTKELKVLEENFLAQKQLYETKIVDLKNSKNQEIDRLQKSLSEATAANVALRRELDEAEQRRNVIESEENGSQTECVADACDDKSSQTTPDTVVGRKSPMFFKYMLAACLTQFQAVFFGFFNVTDFVF